MSLERQPQCELQLTRLRIRTEGTDHAEARGSECSPGLAEVRSVRQVEGFGTELEHCPLCELKVLEEGKIKMPEARPVDAVASRAAEDSERLGGECGSVEPLTVCPYGNVRDANLIRPVGTYAGIGAWARVNDREWLSGLPDIDSVGLPAFAKEGAPAAQFIRGNQAVSEHHGDAVADVQFVIAVLDGARVDGVSAGEKATGGEALDVAERVGPCVVRLSGYAVPCTFDHAHLERVEI